MKKYIMPKAVFIAVTLNDIMTTSPTTGGNDGGVKIDVSGTWGDKLK